MMSILRDEFNRMRPELETTKLIGGAEGAYAEAMLVMVPALLDFMDKQERKAASPLATFEALANVYSNLVVGAVRGTVKKHRRREFMDRMFDHMHGQAREMIGSPTSSLILPRGH